MKRHPKDRDLRVGTVTSVVAFFCMEHSQHTLSQGAAVDAYRHRLTHLRADGRQLRSVLARSPDSVAALSELRIWQRECAATIGQLSGGSKAHWLARAFSEALLVPLAGADSTSITTIIDRIANVLERASASLAYATQSPAGPAPEDAPPRARFTFIADEALRSHLERGYVDGQEAFSRNELAIALVTFCSILEAVVTDALDRLGLERLEAYEPPAGPIVNWPFAARISIAERARVISGGCARLPEAARNYRALLDSAGEVIEGVSVSSRDAKVTRDVLHVILRDLAPGR